MSKKKGTGERILAHRHCTVCFKMVPEYATGHCSSACRNHGKNKEGGSKKTLVRKILSYGIIAVLVIVMLIVFL